VRAPGARSDHWGRPMPEAPDVSQLLRDHSAGQSDALDRLIPIVYAELRAIAHRQLRHERTAHTLSTTALVHEAYLKLVKADDATWHDRAHFLAIAARVMRRILIDYARTRHRDKRGSAAIRVPLSDAAAVLPALADDMVDLDDALSRLETVNARGCRVVECRCFAGLSVEETATALHTSPATVKREWAFARAWLNRRLAGRDGDGVANDAVTT
jgi:RNA polymerase sigma factor (TIGR02999 family)